MFYYIASLRKGTIKVLRQSSEDELGKIEKLQEPIKNLYLQNKICLMQNTSFYRKEAIVNFTKIFPKVYQNSPYK